MLCADQVPVRSLSSATSKPKNPHAAAIAGVHERTAVVDWVRALVLVIYNSMAHKALASYARPARESANIRTTVPAITRVIASNAPMSHLSWDGPPPAGRTAKLIGSRHDG